MLPLVIWRQGAVRTARPLACETTEYCPLLTDPSADVLAVWTAIADGVRDLKAVDAVILPYARDDAALVPFLRGASRVIQTDSFPNHFVSQSAFGCWENYWKQLPRGMRSNLGTRQRRLNELGEVLFEELTDPDASRAAWRWMVDNKRDWLVRKGLDHAFIPTQDYFRFMEATLGVSGPTGRRGIFVLKLDGELMAAELVNVDRRRMEAFIATYDQRFARYGPGQLLRKELLHWAFARGLDFDWRLGDDAYKLEWASHRAVARTYVLPRNLRGWLFGAYLAERTRLAYRTPACLRSKIRGMLKRRAQPETVA
ncbi:MAG TPA: GNAT family N-acetyltransferase [Phenylobacterium sp.]